MTQKELETLYYESCRVVTRAGKFLLQEFGKVNEAQIETKSLNSLVSYADKEAEKMLVEGLAKCLPGSVFLTEEKTVEQESGDYRWIIDPLDGTTNFLHRIPIFAVSVGLRHKDEIILGIVYDPNRSECFYAWKGGGAFLNGKPIRVKDNENLADSLIATGFPYYDFKKTPEYLKILEELMQNTRGLRRMGSAAIDLAYTACGRFDAFYEYKLQVWDVAAGLLLVTEAGGTLSDFTGGEKYKDGAEVIAGSGAVAAAVREVTKRFWK